MHRSPIAIGSLFLAILLFVSTAAGQGTKRIYLAPDDHTDYFWQPPGKPYLADEAGYRAAFLTTLDYYLDLADQTEGLPSKHQSRWNCDGTLWLWEYERNKDAADWQRLLDRMRDGHISAPRNALVPCYGAQPTEAVLRGMYYSGSLERKYDLSFPMAIAMENQTLPLGIGALFAGAGAKYSWKGICGCATQFQGPKLPEILDRDQEIYWWTGLDGSRLLMKWYSWDPMTNLGSYAEAMNPWGAGVHAKNKCFTPKYPFAVAGAFGHGWDYLMGSLLDPVQPNDWFVKAAIELDTTLDASGPTEVIVSNQLDFFEDFEAQYGSSASVPTVSLSYGNEWDVYAATLAEPSAKMKRAVETLRSAEAMASIVAMHDASFYPANDPQRDQIWMDLGMYWEHNFLGGGDPLLVSKRMDWAKQLSSRVADYANTLLGAAARELGKYIPGSQPGTQRFFAFNPLSAARTDIADYIFPEQPVRVLDLATGQEVPSQFLLLEGQSTLRILAPQVPSVGYKVFEIVPGPPTITTGGPIVTANTLENAFYRVTLGSNGAITGLYDKLRGKQFVKTINGRAANDLGAASGTLVVESAGPVSATLKATVAASSPLSRVTRVTLLRDSPRIEIRNEITQNFGYSPIPYTWAFSFDLANPDLWTEEVGAILHDKVSPEGHYAARGARYDWITLNHFADMSGDSVGVTLSNADCLFARLGNSTVGVLDTATPQISVLAGGEGDQGYSIYQQGGETHFLQRFALQTHGLFDATAAMRFSLEHQNPLVTGPLMSSKDSALPTTSFSLLQISDPSVMLWTLKPSEEGIESGLIARTWNVSSSPKSAALSCAFPLSSQSRRASHVETDLGSAVLAKNAIALNCAPQQMQTHRLFSNGAGKTAHYGPSTAGYQGKAPVIVSNSPYIGNSNFQVTLTDARPNSSAYLFFHVVPSNVPFGGGVLLAGTSHWSLATTNANGQGLVDVSLLLPGLESYAGMSIFFQFIVADPAAPMGVAMSNGLAVTLYLP